MDSTLGSTAQLNTIKREGFKQWYAGIGHYVWINHYSSRVCQGQGKQCLRHGSATLAHSNLVNICLLFVFPTPLFNFLKPHM